MFVALIASLFFTLTYATLAAKSRSFALRLTLSHATPRGRNDQGQPRGTGSPGPLPPCGVLRACRQSFL